MLGTRLVIVLGVIQLYCVMVQLSRQPEFSRITTQSLIQYHYCFTMVGFTEHTVNQT